MSYNKMFYFGFECCRQPVMTPENLNSNVFDLIEYQNNLNSQQEMINKRLEGLEKIQVTFYKLITFVVINSFIFTLGMIGVFIYPI